MKLFKRKEKKQENEVQTLMKRMEELEIPSRLLRSKMKQKKFKPDVLSNSTIKFNSVSVDFVFDFYDAFILGERYPNVKIYEAVDDVQNVRKGETGIIDGDGRFCRPYGTAPVKVEISALREKQRKEWSTNEIVNFGIWPEMKEKSGPYIVIDDEDFDTSYKGESFQGSFISHSRGCRFGELVDALHHHYDNIKEVVKRFVWLDIFCASQDENKSDNDNDLINTGLHTAIENFDEVLVFFDEFDNPAPFKRAWCIWELYGMAKNDSHFDIISLRKISSLIAENFLAGNLKILEYLDLINLEQLECSGKKNEKGKTDADFIRDAVNNLEGGFSYLKQTVTDKVRKWVLNFAYNLWLRRLDEMGQKARNRFLKLEQICDVDDGRCLYETGDLLSDFGEYDLAIKFVQAATEIFQSSQDQYEKTRCDNLLGTCFLSKGGFKAALKYYEATLDYLIAQPVKDEINIAVAYTNLGIVSLDLKEFVKAEEFYDKALELEIKLYGKHSVEVISTLINKQNLLNDQEKFDEAVKLGEELLTFQNLKGHRKALVLNNIGSSYCGLRQFEKAVKCSEENLKTLIEIYGPGHQQVGIAYMNLAVDYKNLVRLEDAEKNYIRAREIHEKNKDVFNTAEVKYNLGILYWNQGRKEEAAECFKEARKGFVKFYGPESQEVKNVDLYIRDLKVL